MGDVWVWMCRIVGADEAVKEKQDQLRQLAEAQERLKQATLQFSVSAELQRCRRLGPNGKRIEAKK